MLQQLIVRNFALIQEATVNFDRAYTVITGETGSGKSILLNALNLILGERADYKVIGSTGDKAIVEAVFQIELNEHKSFFETHDIDFDKETIVRREITTQGRSRAFINDVPVQLNVLKEFTERLVSVHSQYNTLELKRKDFQMHTLDLLANTKELQQHFSQLYQQSKSLQRTIDQEKEQLFQLEKEKDYNEFQLKELEELALEKTDFSRLEEQLLQIENATEIQSLTSNLAEGLGGEGAIIDQLQALKVAATKLSRIDASKGNFEERIQSSIIELKDIESELIEAAQQSEGLDQSNVAQLTELLDKYNRILMKHKCQDQNGLNEIYTALLHSASNTSALSEKIEQLEKEHAQLQVQLNELAQTLHKKREQAVPEIESKIKALLSELKLPDTHLKFQLNVLDKLSANGVTELSLLFSANKGFALVEIEKAASGGELSRVMLALQQLISEKTKLPTIFFDEIDTGVSGEVAQKIGNLLQKMAKTMQLFAISHLPQVAAKAQHHFKVEKLLVDEVVQTHIRPLTEEQRVEEIARLMSGETINEAAISNARALMN